MKLRLLILFLGLPAAVMAGGMEVLPGNGDEARYPAKQVILDQAREALMSTFDSDGHRFEVSPRWIPGSLARMPAESVEQVTPNGSVERYTGFDVTYTAGGRRRQAQVQLQVDIEQNVPVMRDRITGGTVITSDDMVMRWIPVPRDRGQLVTNLSEIEGKTVRRTLMSGEPIRKADITTEYLVEVGESVTLIMEQKGMRIDITAVARQDGALHEDIRLYSDETRRTYVGAIAGPGMVIWKRTL